MKRYKYTEIEMRDHLIKCGVSSSSRPIDFSDYNPGILIGHLHAG